MWKLTTTISCIVAGLILALHTINVEGALDLEQCKIAYANFFNSLEGIITGGAAAVTSHRNTYNQCARNAGTYTDLITCAVNAYKNYEPRLRAVCMAKADDIITAHNNFGYALLPLIRDAGLPPAQQGVPIPEFKALVDDAVVWVNTSRQRRGGG